MKKPGSEESSLLQKVPLFGEKDIFSDLTEKKGTSLFLGKYTLSEVFSVLRKRNFIHDARKRKLWPLVYDLDSSEFPTQRFMVFYKEKKHENLVVDLKIREGTFHPKKEIAERGFPSECRFLILDWLTLQNPLLSFSPAKPALPGQNYPGLSLGKKVLDVFVYLARLTRQDGILAYPAYFHNALLFARAFKFLNPEKEAEVLAIKKSFRNVPFKELAWIVYLECLRSGGNRVYEWKAEEQIYPLSSKLEKYFDSKIYKEKVKESVKKYHFSLL